MPEIRIHPAVDEGVKPGAKDFSGGVLRCHCTSNAVEVTITSNCQHNHVCGCTKCWKPKGALFAQVAVVPRDQVRLSKNADKLKVVDGTALTSSSASSMRAFLRNACRECGVHMLGPVERERHPFTGLVFIHTELAKEQGWAPPEFAAFVSSIIESGTRPEKMTAVRARLNQLGLPPYDTLSPGLMDYIATFTAKASGALKD